MKDQKKHVVSIDERTEVFDAAEKRTVSIERKDICDGKFYGTSKLVSVLKAVEANRKDITDLDMIEVEVDGAPFLQG